MSIVTVIEQPRHFCALGAQLTVSAIERAIPILHAGPGCGSKLWDSLAGCNGYQGSGYAGAFAIPCTNTGEREVVFGGETRLRQLIAGALQVMDGDLFVVLTGCTADIVGDDINGVVGEFRERGVPIVHASTGGFKGTNYQGHELVLQALVEQFLPEETPAPVPGLVNVWSAVPYQDPFWSGNLQAIKTLLAGIGLTPNVLFGPGAGGVAAWRQIPAAQFNLVLSPWVGLDTAKLLEARYGTPWLHHPVLPIGATETSRFLRAVGQYAGADEVAVARFIREREAHYYYYLERAADFLLENRYDLPHRFVNIADAAYTLGISRFLVNDLGLWPGHQFVTDQTPAEHQEWLAGEFAHLAPKVSAPVVFTPDADVIRQTLRQARYREAPIILGSAWDRDLAHDLKGYLLGISLPVSGRLVLDRTYVGYEGGLRLAEDLYSAICGTYH